ncbi:MAG: HAMP domain-containing sensor histidine kinase [Pseudomonadota bacterium]
MSFARDAGAWRSASVRRFLLITLVVWACALSSMLLVLSQVRDALLEPLTAVVLEEIEELQGVAQSDELEVWLWFEGDLARRSLDLGDVDHDDFDTVLADYARRLQLMREGVDDEGNRRAIDARLWLIGSGALLPTVERPFEFYVELLRRELPPRWHHELSPMLRLREPLWPTAWRWSAMSPPERFAAVLAGVAQQLDPGDRCMRLGERDGEAPRWQDLKVTGSPAMRAVSLSGGALLAATTRRCWVHEMALDEAGQFLDYGIIADDTLRAVYLGERYGQGAALASLVGALVLGALLGLRLHGRVRQIEAFSDQVRRGDLSSRLPVRGAGDDIDRLCATLNAMLDQVEQQIRGVRQVSDDIAHDLRSPLTRLRNRIEHLTQAAAPRAEDVAQIAEEADQVLATFTALLRIAQLEQGGPREAFTAIDLAQICREVTDLYEPVFTDSQIQLVAALPRSASIVGHRGLWAQALTNLLENALKYASGSARVTLSMRRAGSRWHLEVRDQGPGVPEHALTKLTERFYRVEAHRGSAGTGLGLSLVAAVSGLHEAELRVANDGGLVVTVAIPAAPEGSQSPG